MASAGSMRTEAEAIEHAKWSPRARAAREVVGALGIAFVGDQPGQRYVAFANGPSRCGEIVRVDDIASVMLDAPGARHSEVAIDFPGLGKRFATLVPMAIVMETLMTPRAFAHAFGRQRP